MFCECHKGEKRKMDAKAGDTCGATPRARLRGLALCMTMVSPSILFWPGSAAALTPIELLGKNVFFDKISKPADTQACASCHDPKVGWTLPDSQINKTTVSAPGARVKRRGSLKTPTNAYATFSPTFRVEGTLPGGFRGGNFWDGRAEGHGANGDAAPPIGDGAVSDTVRPQHIPQHIRPELIDLYETYLGPTTDQALNPFPNAVEQNVRIKRVCRNVRDADYSYLYTQAYGEAISCKGKETDPNSDVSISYKRIALALGAYQASSEVNSFSSRRDKELKKDGRFPLDGFTDEENLGHDIFYGLNDTGRNREVAFDPLVGGPAPLNARCALCHNGVRDGDAADPRGEAPEQLYTDNSYHNIGLPYNREVRQKVKGSPAETVARLAKTGLSGHVTTSPGGLFKTPTLRNVAKGATGSFTKAYMHNGYFKSLEDVIHFYNTRDTKPACANPDATAAEALAADCWPDTEFSGEAPSIIVGDLGLLPAEEAALVAYVKTLSDTVTPRAP